jgi:hypothetical protein
VFENLYGSSDVICMWLAPDSTTLRAAPSVADVMARHLGATRAARFMRRLDSLFPVTSSLAVERSTAMSNLGKAVP